MRSKGLFHRPRNASLLFLVLAVLGLVLVPQVHATGIMFKSKCNAETAGATTLNCVLTGVANSDTIIANIFGNGVFNSFTVSDSQSNAYTEQIFSLTGVGGGSSTYIFATLSTVSSGSLTVTVTTGGATRIYRIVISDYSGVTGFGKTGTDQQDTASAAGSSSVSLSGTGGTSAFIDNLMIQNGNAGSVSATSGQTVRDTTTVCSTLFVTCNASDSTTPIDGWSWTGLGSCPCSESHSTLELQGSVSGPINTVFQCYGNCGNPPITLVNTNSTHTVNFNQSITLFYEFQSNINGFLLNITMNMAKSYVAIPNGPAFGIYVIPSCPQGVTPFSPQCPGLLQQQSGGQNFFSPPKGRISFSNLRIPVSTGQWVGIALSATFAGLDVNDTNTGINLFQTNEGKIPSSIQQPASLGSSKMGLWAWISGNAVVGQGPVSPPSGQCGPGLDFILACAVNSLCTVVTSQCQTGSSILLIVILTIFSIAILLGILTYWLPGMNISTKGMGEFAVLIFIGWFVAFAAYGLLLPYMIILMFFVVAWLFLGRSRGTGPI